MRILVTGGHGFLGQAVCRELAESGEEVSAPRSKEFDLRTPAGVDAALEMAQPDVVIHLAATVGGIGLNASAPGQLFYENAVMGIELMERARRLGVGKFVTVGTACEYPADAPLPISEDSLWDGYPAAVTAPYGLAKKILLVQGQAYREQYDFNAVHLIPANLYGPRDNFDLDTGHVIASLIRRVAEAEAAGARTVTCWGTGDASREFLYVDDAAHGVVLATDYYNRPEPVNLGSGVEVRVRTLAEMIARLIGYEGVIEWDTSKPDGTPRRRLDTSRAEREFGFRAEVPLAEGLRRTIAWYEAEVA